MPWKNEKDKGPPVAWICCDCKRKHPMDKVRCDDQNCELFAPYGTEDKFHWDYKHWKCTGCELEYEGDEKKKHWYGR
jgi:hypothetical protein